MSELVKLNRISKTFYSMNGETNVISNVSFSIDENEIVSIIGPSGCGKSTILNIISSLEEQNEGEIMSNAKLGYMFQKDALLPWRNVLDNVIFPLEIKKIKTKDNIKYAIELIDKYGLSSFKKHYPNDLSGGMKQRVSLIRTLVLRPNLLLLDEPFSALDAQTKLFVQEDVFKIIKNEKISSLIVTHDISEAIALSNRIIILSKRPCSIVKIINIPFVNLSPSERRKHKDFTLLFNEVFSNLDE